MVVKRLCAHRDSKGHPCGAPPLLNSEYCLFHDPERAQEVTEARWLGGIRRKRELITSGAYEFEGLDSVAHIRRLLEVAIVDTLGLENSIARARTLGYLALSGIKLLEVGEHEERLRALEAAVKGPRMNQPPVFDQTFEEQFELVEAEG
jgi:hypothetical protein